MKTSTSIMGPYSPVAYDVGCRGDSYSPDGPCYGTLLAQQAWVTKLRCNSASSPEQFLWVGDQWLSVGSNPKTFGNSRQAWVPFLLTIPCSLPGSRSRCDGGAGRKRGKNTFFLRRPTRTRTRA